MKKNRDKSASADSPDRKQDPGGRATGMQPARLIEVDDEAGQRIDNFLLKKMSSVPKSRVYRMLRSGEVRVNGGRKGPTYRLCAGDRVRIPPHRTAEMATANFIGDRTLAELEAAILFEDADLLVVNKPAGIAVHGGSGLAFGLIEAMRRLRGDRLELVHRLDRDTSGCLLIAKRRPTLSALHELIRTGALQKYYQLIVHGRWPKDLQSVRFPLHKFQTASGERRVRVAADGKASQTDFLVLQRGDQATLLQAQLLTGRTHQIRVHALAAGHAVVGDSKYASDQELAQASGLGIRRLCLHAQRVLIPWDGTQLEFQCQPPDDFVAAWKLLGGQDISAEPAR